jgi:pimeloyl-ACP methyl ester carboxylesterase
MLTVIVFQVRAEEVSIIVNGCNLKGTLETPKSEKPIDVVLLISGSGPTDRDGNSSGKNNSLKMLSDLFYKNGVASLRYDKRGIGASDKMNEADLTFDLYINDVVEWVKFLKKDKRFSRIIIAGHSEGSLLGMIAAKRTDVYKYISLCGAGQPAYSIISEQLKKSGLPQDQIDQSDKLLDSLRNGYNIKNYPPILYSLFRPSIQKYLISWIQYDPIDEISKLTIPILIVGGTTDIQVDTLDAVKLNKACKNSELVIIKDMNHILKEVGTKDRSLNIASYGNPALQLSVPLCSALIEFIKK